MSSKHTAGPWDYRAGSDPHNQGQVYSSAGATIAITYSDEGGHNARLIAVAPELLEALEELSTVYGCECIETRGHCPMCQARALLQRIANP